MRICSVIILLTGLLLGCAHTETESVAFSDPGFRPLSDDNSEIVFRNNIDKIGITVFPTVIHYMNYSEYHRNSSDRICVFIEKYHIGNPQAVSQEIDLRDSLSPVQWDIFQKSKSAFARYLREVPIDTEYAFLMECLVAPGRAETERIGGIQCYLLDAQGRNVFSFLLNSHHQLFINSQLYTEDSSLESRGRLIEKATDVAMRALRLQLNLE